MPSETPADLALAWRAALAGMRALGEPCPGISAERWPVIREGALDFLEAHGPRAVELGWTAEDLFGVHPRFGTQRVDHAGALLCGDSQPVTAFDATHMRYRHSTFYRDKPGRPVGIPIWAFKE